MARTGSEQGSKAKVGRCQGEHVWPTHPAFGQQHGGGRRKKPVTMNRQPLPDSWRPHHI